MQKKRGNTFNTEGIRTHTFSCRNYEFLKQVKVDFQNQIKECLVKILSCKMLLVLTSYESVN